MTAPSREEVEALADSLQDHSNITNITGGYPLDRETLTGTAAETLRALLAQRERDEEVLARWRENSRETFDAMCAMRNDLNEMFPMPSLESDLLQGPEASVFFAAVVQAVRNARERDEKVIEAARALSVQAAHVALGATISEMNIHEAARNLSPLVGDFDAALAARDAGGE